MVNAEGICEIITFAAMRAVMYEVSATPKPGLVDQSNSGAHQDMDFYTFVDSCSAISPYFYQMAKAGVRFQGPELTLLFSEIRLIGQEAESKMFTATKGVNTHKGIVFSIGILSAAAAYLMAQEGRELIESESLCDLVPEMVGDLCSELYQIDAKNAVTHGEKLYLKYGFTGIRGEVKSGFTTVLSHGLPLLRAHAGQKNTNDLLVNTLLKLMVETDDSNILHRHDMKTLTEVKKSAGELLAIGGMFTQEGQKQVAALDSEFIRRNISPGGSADLLAVTVFLGLMEGLRL